jgi:peptide/nickel transport system permease protein
MSVAPAGAGGGHRAWARAVTLAKRTAHLLTSVMLTFLGLTGVTFFIGRVIPIDPVLAIVGDKASPETYARVRAEIGLDLPLPVQYWRYLMKVLHGDFGNSVITSHPVLQDLLRVFPATLELAVRLFHAGVLAGADRPAAVLRPARLGRWAGTAGRVVRRPRRAGHRHDHHRQPAGW